MISAEALDPIWDWYQTTCDCLRVTQRVIDQQAAASLKQTRFVGLTPAEAGGEVKKSRESVDDFAVLWLWAVFEREVLA